MTSISVGEGFIVKLGCRVRGGMKLCGEGVWSLVV